MNHRPDAAEVTAFAVDAFETAFAANPTTDVCAFVPVPSHPHFNEVLAELIRVDLELRWRRGRPVRLWDYLDRWPILTSDSTLLAGIAFEEYRQRRLAGELVSAAEYGEEYGIDVAAWPPIQSRPVRSR
jgi:hypothetical protein